MAEQHPPQPQHECRKLNPPTTTSFFFLGFFAFYSIPAIYDAALSFSFFFPFRPVLPGSPSQWGRPTVYPFPFFFSSLLFFFLFPGCWRGATTRRTTSPSSMLDAIWGLEQATYANLTALGVQKTRPQAPRWPCPFNVCSRLFSIGRRGQASERMGPGGLGRPRWRPEHNQVPQKQLGASFQQTQH